MCRIWGLRRFRGQENWQFGFQGVRGLGLQGLAGYVGLRVLGFKGLGLGLVHPTIPQTLNLSPVSEPLSYQRRWGLAIWRPHLDSAGICWLMGLLKDYLGAC